jgi:hypothetical protein
MQRGPFACGHSETRKRRFVLSLDPDHALRSNAASAPQTCPWLPLNSRVPCGHRDPYAVVHPVRITRDDACPPNTCLLPHHGRERGL